jgi:uncharacterized membrane protein
MQRHAIDRWADTTVFRCLLVFSAIAVLPVLAMGVLTTVIGGAAVLIARSPVDLEQAGFAGVSIGGVLGYLGWLRAHLGIRNPRRYDLTTSLLLLTAGVVAAVAVAGFVLAEVVESWLEPWGRSGWLVLGVLFAAANLVWAFSGIAWMQRLMSDYAEKTGRVFDGVPVMLLFTAIALAVAATLKTITL